MKQKIINDKYYMVPKKGLVNPLTKKMRKFIY